MSRIYDTHTSVAYTRVKYMSLIHIRADRTMIYRHGNQARTMTYLLTATTKSEEVSSDPSSFKVTLMAG